MLKTDKCITVIGQGVLGIFHFKVDIPRKSPRIRISLNVSIDLITPCQHRFNHSMEVFALFVNLAKLSDIDTECIVMYLRTLDNKFHKCQEATEA